MKAKRREPGHLPIAVMKCMRGPEKPGVLESVAEVTDAVFNKDCRQHDQHARKALSANWVYQL